MKKFLTLISMISILIFFNLTANAQVIDATSTGNWSGYMNVFDNAGGAQGGFLFGSNWGAADLRASHTGDSLTLLPNTNGYADVVDDAGRAYWTNSPDGGVTAGPDGNKWLEANYYLEATTPDNTGWNGQSLTFSGNIDGFTLDNRYSTVAFIKTLDVANGFSTVQNVEHSITSTGNFALSLDILQGNYIAQIGFTMSGLNANPATDWGNVQLSGITATAVPEPSTYALMAGFATFLFIAIRRRK